MTVVFIGITPATWYSLPGYFIYTLTSSASFLRWNGYELYCGELYKYLENSLPWHYFLVCFGIRTPLIFLGGIIAGQMGCLYLLFKKGKKNWQQLKYMLIFALMIWVPMAFFMFKGANVTFRHFLFLYPELVLMAVYILGKLSNRDKVDRIIEAVVGIQSIVCVMLIIAGHPFQNTYFNVLAGFHVDERFEYENTDYYKEALEEILRIDQRDTVLISSDNWNCYFGIKQAWEVLSPSKKGRICIAEPETEECSRADYHIYGQSTLVKENMEIVQEIQHGNMYTPSEKYNTEKQMDTYGKTVVTIYYNN